MVGHGAYAYEGNAMNRIIRATVREEVLERETLDFEVPDDLDIEDEDALQAYLEMAFVEGSYRVVPNTKELAIEERAFFDPELLTQKEPA